MKQSIRFCWLIGILLVPAACKPATPAITVTPPSTRTTAPTPPPTATQTLTPTSYLTPIPRSTKTLIPTLTAPASYTPSPTTTATLLLPIPEARCHIYALKEPPSRPIPMPEADASAYHLKNQTEEDILGLIREMDQANPPCGDYSSAGLNSFETQNDRRFAVQLALEETLWRFPNIPNRDVFEWRLALTNSWLSDLLTGGTVDSSLTDQWSVATIERALNDEIIAPEHLTDWLMPQGFKIVMVDVGSATGEYNNRLDELETITDTISIYAQWSSYPDGVSFVPVRNLFGDGQVAYLFLLTNADFGGGLLVALRQDNQGHYDLHLIRGFWNVINGVIENYEFGDQNGNGIPEIVLATGEAFDDRCATSAYIYEWQADHFHELTQGGIGYYSYSCFVGIQYESPERQGFYISNSTFANTKNYYQWNGQFYQWVRREWNVERLSPHPFYIAETVNDGDFNASFQMVENGLKKYEPTQTQFPGMMDYLRFQRGLLYALQGKSDDAQAEIKELIRQSPSNLISQAAQVFLDNYVGDQGLYRACSASVDVMRKALAPFRDANGALTPEQAAAAWGYTDEWGPAPLCNLDLIIPYLVRQFNTVPISDLPTALRDAGVIVEHSARLDVDGDGDQDWIEIISKLPVVEQSYATIWVFLQNGQGLSAIHMNSGIIDNGIEAQAAHETFFVDTFSNPEGNRQPVMVLRSGNRLFTFQVLSGQGGVQLEQSVHFWGEITAYSFTTDQGAPKLIVNYPPSAEKPSESYFWDAQTNDFKPEQYMLETLAERAAHPMLQGGSPAEAVAALQAIVAYPPEACSVDDPSYAYICDSRLIRRSRYPYLLALAYELSGDEIAAVQAYWQLWHNFPHSPYALMARAKLEAK